MRPLRAFFQITWMVCLLAAAPHGICAGPNLVHNASFEEDQNADGVPDGWTHGAGHHGRWQEKVKKQLA